MKQRVLSGIILSFFSLLISSCGLDTFYFLNAPRAIVHSVTYENSDPLINYLSFNTYENQSHLPSDFSFDGTLIYYRIYTNTNSIASLDAEINSVNNSSNYNTAVEKLISKKYQPLYYLSGGTKKQFAIDRNNFSLGSVKNIEIRLSDYNGISSVSPEASYLDHISVNGTVVGTPLREHGSKNSFNFGWCNYAGNTETCKCPASGDDDFEDGTVTDGWYYINLYAFAYGHDTTFKTYYSNVLHLGCLKVKSPSDNNW
nr:hypothetical protein [uncultured Treponema sp.]